MCHATELHTLTQPKFCLIACDIVQSKNRRRVGRPIAYKGDPDAKILTEGERRKVKRRIANCESARRVRARRAETLGELQIKVRPVPAHPHWFTLKNGLRQEKCSAGCHAIETGSTACIALRQADAAGMPVPSLQTSAPKYNRLHGIADGAPH